MPQPEQSSYLHRLAPPRAAEDASVYLLARRALAATFRQLASKEVSA